jgi:hypothetical protein
MASPEGWVFGRSGNRQALNRAYDFFDFRQSQRDQFRLLDGAAAPTRSGLTQLYGMRLGPTGGSSLRRAARAAAGYGTERSGTLATVTLVPSVTEPDHFLTSAIRAAEQSASGLRESPCSNRQLWHTLC